MAKMGETGEKDTVAKMGGTHFGKNGWNSPLQKWWELVLHTLAKMDRTHCVKMGGTHCGKNGWSSPWQKWVKLVLKTPWQKWVELIVAKMDGVNHGKNG